MTPELRPFVVEYKMGGRAYGDRVEAFDFDDALRRMRAMGVTGRVLGPLTQEIFVMPGSARWHTLWLALKNLVRP